MPKVIRNRDFCFSVASTKHAEVCRRQSCRTHGEHVISVYPEFGKWLNLPFKVSLSSEGEPCGFVRTQRFRLVSLESKAYGKAVWEVEA